MAIPRFFKAVLAFFAIICHSSSLDSNYSCRIYRAMIVTMIASGFLLATFLISFINCSSFKLVTLNRVLNF